MNVARLRRLPFTLMLMLSLDMYAQSSPNLWLEPHTNAFDVTVSSITDTGALLIFCGPEVHEGSLYSTVFFQTNTPLLSGLAVPFSPSGSLSSQAFFSAMYSPGSSVDDFGDPENIPDIPPPDMILLTGGQPDILPSGQSFTVEFFVTDPAGTSLDINGTAAILVMRESDGAIHPDALVTPATGQMTGGYMSVEITIQSTTSLDGYTLGIGPADGNSFTGTASGRLQSATAAASSSVPTLPTCANTSPASLNALRTASVDPDSTWSYPIAGATMNQVAGTFGEWRGIKYVSFHHGVDLVAPETTTVIASRGGVVSKVGSLGGCLGHYVAIDHGDGWFSRYLHLDLGSITVTNFQAVSRGDTLATKLWLASCWSNVHLHFEMRKNANVPAWCVGQPGDAQDPLQTPGIFSVEPGTELPKLEEVGLIRKHPAQVSFVKSDPYPASTGPVYVFARFLDVELKNSGPGDYRLVLRAAGFKPEGTNEFVWVSPSNDVEIAELKPPVPPSIPSSTKIAGFARYKTASPNRNEWFRYWWKWNTSVYTNSPTGPRIFVLRGIDADGNTTDYTNTFGPQIKGEILAQPTPGVYLFTNVCFLGTNIVAELVQPDQYRFQILQDDGTEIQNVLWTGTVNGNMTDVLRTHMQETGYGFTISPAPEIPEQLKLRVSSLLVTDLMHEVHLTDMAYIPAGAFAMGDTFAEGSASERPVHTVYISAFYMDRREVTKALWDDVATWAASHGYDISASSGSGKAANHPVQEVTWYECVKWCNARSEKEGLTPCYYTSGPQTTVYRTGNLDVAHGAVNWNATGYRLPTEAEWEKAARGGTAGHRFPWSYVDTITHSQANYYSSSSYAYDISPTRGYHPTYAVGGSPYTSPVGSFAANGYGLYDMAGNVWDWCWDWYDGNWYSNASATLVDCLGPVSGSFRLLRGGGWRPRVQLSFRQPLQLQPRSTRPSPSGIGVCGSDCWC
jgi:formylglycine-generating enzyme required for sulfatase activity/murein DD-endopeptidase MepM/ murein hydrolase activator NlpD